ncbi:MAG: electron transfer flavoprotein subunit alpha/FixB family protein, partial [Solirubrobacteraceae bacterium]
MLALIEHAEDELSRQAFAFAQAIEPEVAAVTITGDAYAPAAWANTVVELITQRAPTTVVAPGTDRGNEIMAHVAAQLDQPMAANCVSLAAGDPATVVRVRWGGSLLEEARVHGSPLLVTTAPHAVLAAPAPDLEIVQAVQNGAVAVSEHLTTTASGVSLADADVVVSGGRGVGSAEGFAIVEELAQLLGGAVGCSRAVTSAGWRPHTDQVGQTGTKISADLYVACGISGATQHIAGAKGAKRILAINSDPEAPILAVADYAVIGDLHEVVP